MINSIYKEGVRYRNTILNWRIENNTFHHSHFFIILILLLLPGRNVFESQRNSKILPHEAIKCIISLRMQHNYNYIEPFLIWIKDTIIVIKPVPSYSNNLLTFSITFFKIPSHLIDCVYLCNQFDGVPSNHWWHIINTSTVLSSQ